MPNRLSRAARRGRPTAQPQESLGRAMIAIVLHKHVVAQPTLTPDTAGIFLEEQEKRPLRVTATVSKTEKQHQSTCWGSRRRGRESVGELAGLPTNLPTHGQRCKRFCKVPRMILLVIRARRAPPPKI